MFKIFDKYFTYCGTLTDFSEEVTMLKSKTKKGLIIKAKTKT